MTDLLIASRARVSSDAPCVLGRVLHRAHADDDALAGHQPGHRVDGADRARVGDGRGGALEVVDRELAHPRPAHDVLVAGPEQAEVHLLRRLDVRHQQLPGAVGGLHVDGQAQVDVLGPGHGGLAVLLGVGVVHLRQRLERLDHRVPDQVGERHLAAAAAAQVVVDDDPVIHQQLGRHRTDAGGRGHGQAGRHVGDGAGRGAAQPADLGAREAAGGGGAGPACGAGAGCGPGPGRPAGPGPAPVRRRRAALARARAGAPARLAGPPGWAAR